MSAAQTSLPTPPAHPFPIRSASSSGGTQLTILQRSPPKEEAKKKPKDERKGAKGKEETSSRSSQETELDATLPEKGNKKKVEAKLDHSPKESSPDDGSEDSAFNGSGLPLLSSSGGGEENSPTNYYIFPC